jgi:hypothetical protein
VGVRGVQRLAPHVQENLRHGGHEGHKKGDKPGHCASHGKEMQIKQTKVGQGPALQTARCVSRDKMVYWYCSLNVFGSQIFDH